MGRRKNPNKISRGYRLRSSTHKIIAKLQMYLEEDQDTVITNACIMYYNAQLSVPKKTKQINKNQKSSIKI